MYKYLYIDKFKNIKQASENKLEYLSDLTEVEIDERHSNFINKIPQVRLFNSKLMINKETGIMYLIPNMDETLLNELENNEINISSVEQDVSTVTFNAMENEAKLDSLEQDTATIVFNAMENEAKLASLEQDTADLMYMVMMGGEA